MLHRAFFESASPHFHDPGLDGVFPRSWLTVEGYDSIDCRWSAPGVAPARLLVWLGKVTPALDEGSPGV
jgi:hypothetical protein